jgi:4-hydroxy-3-methylbut-2-en-1-yl diphosphate reductase
MSPAAVGRVILAAPRGYCAGVERAVQSVERALERADGPVYVRKQVVHNRFIVESLTERGAIFVEELSEVPPGATVVFSAHGVSPEVHLEARERSLTVIDATCPLVTKVHRQAERFAQKDYDIVLIGHTGHEEVVGTAGHAPGHVRLLDDADDLESVQVRDSGKVAWLSQTTLSVTETIKRVDALRQRYPALADPPSQDICYATQNRQDAVREIAGDVDLMIVVGSANSSNSVRLVEVALENGAGSAWRVDRADEIDERWLEGARTIGLTSGASVPEVLIDEVLAWLDARGYPTVEQVTTTTENVTFALPGAIRRDENGGNP